MTTQILIEDRFACSAESLYKLLSDNAFDDKLMDALSMRKELLDSHEVPGGVQYRIRLSNPEDIPAIAVKFTGAHLSYVETRTWQNATSSNTWIIEPEVRGATVEAKGKTEIVPADGGCVRRTTGTISVNLPLIGKKIESMVLESITATFKKNAKYCQDYLRENGIS